MEVVSLRAMRRIHELLSERLQRDRLDLPLLLQGERSKNELLERFRSLGNAILIGSSGLGKTMIAQNIVHRAVLAGHTALFITASELLLDLAGQDSPRALENRLRHYAKIGVLAIDEVGFLPFDSRNADLFFQVVSRRYERKSVVLTTNLAFTDWNTVFPNAACATALIERLVHHSDIITIEGESYRVREAERSAQERRTSLRGKPKRG